MEKTFISLFGGIGGFDLALTRNGWKSVWYNDFDKYAVKTYNKNFGTQYEPMDITKVDAKTIPSHTLLCGGFPCQSFSIAGKRKGFGDTRGTMFFEICRIAKECRTPFLLLENVKGLLSHDEGRTFKTILRTLDELGYDAEWQVLNSKHFSVPQNRERVFIIANLRTMSRPKIFPLCHNAGTVSEIFEGKESDVMVYDRKGFDSRTKGFRESIEVPTLSVKMGTGGNNVPMVISHSPRSGNPKLGGTGVLVSEEHCFTIDSTPHLVNGIRRLTPLECERLQGFPDDWTEGVSDTQRYKQLGNAVTVNVVEAIIQKFNETIK